MPKVLRIINRLNLGGPTYNAALLTKHLSPEFDTLLVAGMKDDSEESSDYIVRDLELEPIYIPEMFREVDFYNDRRSYKKIKELIKAYKPDIVHTHAAKAGALGRLAAHDLGVPVVLHTFHGHVFHSYFSPLKTRLFIEVERYLAKKSTGIIAISEKQKEELWKIFKICDPQKIEVIPLGFDLNRFHESQQDKRETFRNKYHVADDEVAIGIIGRIVPIKNHELFLKAWKIVLEKTTKKVKAFIIGDGEDRLKTEQTAQNLGIKTGIDGSTPLTFTSWIKDIDVAYAGLDIITLTSRNEGTPVSLIEAQAAGKPIVCTNVGGIENIVEPNVTALLVDSNEPQEFAEKLLRLIEDRKLLEEFSCHSKQKILEKFQYQRLMSDMKEYYFRKLSEI